MKMDRFMPLLYNLLFLNYQYFDVLCGQNTVVSCGYTLQIGAAVCLALAPSGLRFVNFAEICSTVKRTSLTSKSMTLQHAMCDSKNCTDTVLPYVKPSHQSEPYDAVEHAAIVIISLIGIVTVMSTAYDLHFTYFLKKEPAKVNKLLRAWSLPWNIGRLLTLVESPGSLACLDGIRALSALWVIIFHTCCRMLDLCTNKYEIMYGAISNQKYLLPFAGHIGVDSFFVLSGLLLVYTTASKTKRMSLRDFPLFFSSRYVRLFPLLAVAVLVNTVMPRLVAGSLESHIVRNAELCQTYWWSVFLHVQNIVNPTTWCLEHSWYLSVEMQLFLLVSPIVLYWVVRGPRAAWRSLIVAALLSQALTCGICFYFNFPDARGQISNLLPNEFWLWYYYNPVARSPPFFFGMLLGYCLHVNRNRRIELSKWSVFLCYSLALVMSVSAIFAVHPSIQSFWTNQLALNFRHAIFRSCWALALCWLILACAHGYGGPVNWFLCLKPWRFLARISYAMYLFSFLIQRNTRGVGAGDEYQFNTQTLFGRFAIDLAYTTAVSVGATILIEAPVLTLYNLLLKRIQSKQK